MKQYEIEIKGKATHGRWGKAKYFNWVLESDKKENVINFAYDILAGMTPKEIDKEKNPLYYIDWHHYIKNNDGSLKRVEMDNNSPIGYEEAERRFTVYARLLKG